MFFIGTPITGDHASHAFSQSGAGLVDRIQLHRSGLLDVSKFVPLLPFDELNCGGIMLFSNNQQMVTLSGLACSLSVLGYMSFLRESFCIVLRPLC